MKKFKTIWYISKYIMPPSECYVGNRGHYLIKELKELGYKTYIINSNSYNKMRNIKLKKKYNFRNLDNLYYLTIDVLKYYKSYSMRRVLSWLDFELKLLFAPLYKLSKPDILIVSSLSLLTIINGLVIKFRYKCKLIFEIRDIWPLSLIEYKGYSKNNPIILLLRLIEYIGYFFSDQIVGTMPLLSEHVSSIIGNHKKVKIIPIGFDINAANIENKITNKTINKFLDSDAVTITYLGSIGVSNKLETFFETIEKLSHNKNINFLVIGEGELKNYFIKNYGYLENLAICDSIKKKYVNNILKRSDILYLSLGKNKIWDYGQSLNKLIDYMLASRPIVASYTGYKSMINEANCGEFVEAENCDDLENKFIELSKLTNEERSKIGERGKTWLRKHRTYKKLALDYSLIIENL